MAERSCQVKLMADIYTLTRRVVVWLGPEGEESSLALDLLEVLSTNVEVNWLKRTMKPISEEDCHLHWADGSKELPFNPQEGLAIVNLLKRSWFEVSIIIYLVQITTAKHCTAIVDMAGDMAGKLLSDLNVWAPNYTLDDI
jgi:hypothetical protein